jgi:hypothetical protein
MEEDDKITQILNRHKSNIQKYADLYHVEISEPKNATERRDENEKENQHFKKKDENISISFQERFSQISESFNKYKEVKIDEEVENSLNFPRISTIIKKYKEISPSTSLSKTPLSSKYPRHYDGTNKQMF